MQQNLRKSTVLQRRQVLVEQYLANQGKLQFLKMLSVADKNDLYPPLASSLRFWYNSSMEPYPPHSHGAFEMIMPIEGNYQATVGRRTFDLCPGDIFLIPGSQIHELRAPSRGGRFILLFELEALLQTPGASCLADCLTRPILINRSSCPGICDEAAIMAEKIVEEYLHEAPLRDITIYSGILSLLLLYARYKLAPAGDIHSSRPDDTAQISSVEKFNAIVTYLDLHFAEDLTLDRVAEVAGFSRYHFSRTFKQLTGCNFYEYLCRRRVASAEGLLMDPALSVSQIALQSGFSSVSTFNRMFRKLKGCTPTEYRSQFRVTDISVREGAESL